MSDYAADVAKYTSAVNADAVRLLPATSAFLSNAPS